MVKPLDPGSKGKGKGKIKLEVCMWDGAAGAWKLKSMPAHAAPKLIENGVAVYPVGGECPIDPPIEDDEEEME